MPIQSADKSDCIDEIFEKYSDMIFRVAVSHVRTRNDALDICQEVFLKYVKKNLSFENEEHRKNWFIRVTVNCCKSFLRSAWHRKSIFSANNDYAQTPFEDYDKRTDVHNALQQIPVKYRTVIHLFYFEELSVREISDILKIKESTVKSQLMRGRKLMYELLKGEYFNE